MNLTAFFTIFLLIAFNVILRYLFSVGPVSFQEAEWHLISPIVMIGIAYAMRYQETDHICQLYLGDGAISNGAFHEAANLAGLWGKSEMCPCLFILENNQYGMGTSVERATAMTELGNRDKQEVGRWANNRVENSHLPFQRRERVMQGFRSPRYLQRFVGVFSAVRNLFVPPRSRRSACATHLHRLNAMAEWKIAANVAA